MSHMYTLPDREFVDVTPELIAEIAKNLPDAEEGTFALTVKTDSLRRLLEQTGATVRGYRQAADEHHAQKTSEEHGNG